MHVDLLLKLAPSFITPSKIILIYSDMNLGKSSIVDVCIHFDQVRLSIPMYGVPRSAYALLLRHKVVKEINIILTNSISYKKPTIKNAEDFLKRCAYASVVIGYYIIGNLDQLDKDKSGYKFNNRDTKMV